MVCLLILRVGLFSREEDVKGRMGTNDGSKFPTALTEGQDKGRLRKSLLKACLLVDRRAENKTREKRGFAAVHVGSETEKFYNNF